MNKVFNLSNYTNINSLVNDIKETISNNCEFFIIKNDLFLGQDHEIIDYYNKLNNLLGQVKEVDKNKYNDENQDDYWVDVEYRFDKVIDLEPWKSNEQLMLHTDNTLSNKSNLANISELVCIQPSVYSGETVIISNNKIIEIVKYLDKINNTNFYNELLNTKIHHKLVEKNICIKNNNTYTFNFNISQILKSHFNTEECLKVANKFSTLLENILKSSLVYEIRLEKGDALLFNDTLVMHGRKYVFGERLYKKCSILV
jgi:hypothetical protein